MAVSGKARGRRGFRRSEIPAVVLLAGNVGFCAMAIPVQIAALVSRAVQHAALPINVALMLVALAGSAALTASVWLRRMSAPKALSMYAWLGFAVIIGMAATDYVASRDSMPDLLIVLPAGVFVIGVLCGSRQMLVYAAATLAAILAFGIAYRDAGNTVPLIVALGFGVGGALPIERMRGRMARLDGDVAALTQAIDAISRRRRNPRG